MPCPVLRNLLPQALHVMKIRSGFGLRHSFSSAIISGKQDHRRLTPGHVVNPQHSLHSTCVQIPGVEWTKKFGALVPQSKILVAFWHWLAEQFEFGRFLLRPPEVPAAPRKSPPRWGACQQMRSGGGKSKLGRAAVRRAGADPGKTGTIYGLLAYLLVCSEEVRESQDPSLVVVPPHLLKQWRDELRVRGAAREDLLTAPRWRSFVNGSGAAPRDILTHFDTGVARNRTAGPPEMVVAQDKSRQQSSNLNSRQTCLHKADPCR